MSHVLKCSCTCRLKGLEYQSAKADSIWCQSGEPGRPPNRVWNVRNGSLSLSSLAAALFYGSRRIFTRSHTAGYIPLGSCQEMIVCTLTMQHRHHSTCGSLQMTNFVHCRSQHVPCRRASAAQCSHSHHSCPGSAGHGSLADSNYILHLERLGTGLAPWPLSGQPLLRQCFKL